MGNVPDIICERPCIHVQKEKCTKPREWRDLSEDCTWGGHYCVDRQPDTCKFFEKRKMITAKFEMSLWQRIRAASLMWWDIVVTGELECADDEVDE